MNPILNRTQNRQPKADDFKVIKQQLTRADVDKYIQIAKQRGIADSDIQAGLRMLGFQ